VSCAELTEQRNDMKLTDILTIKEQAIVELVSEGLDNKEISVALKKAHGTVKTQVSHIMKKTGIHRRWLLARRWLEERGKL
jgi:DNA-binding NarL/FixJ family response regulator